MLADKVDIALDSASTFDPLVVSEVTSSHKNTHLFVSLTFIDFHSLCILLYNLNPNPYPNNELTSIHTKYYILLKMSRFPKNVLTLLVKNTMPYLQEQTHIISNLTLVKKIK